MIAESHPLFPAKDEDEDPPRVCSIHVKRNGETFPRKFLPEELTDLEQLSAAWGGGRYTLIARDEQRITGSVDYVIPGPSRPFMPEGMTPPDSPHATPAPLPVAPGGDATMAILTFVSQQQTSTMQMFAQMSQHQSEMLLAMMNRQSEAQLAHQREIAQLHERAASRDAAMFSALIQSAGGRGGADPQASFLQGVTLAQKLMDRGGGGDDGVEGLLETAGQILAGVQQASGGAPAAPPAGQPQPLDPAEAAE